MRRCTIMAWAARAGAAALLAAMVMPAFAIRTTPAIISCVPRPSGTQDERIKALWPQFERTFWRPGSAAAAAVGNWYQGILPLWQRYRAASPDTPEAQAARAAWQAAIAKDDSSTLSTTYLAGAQLDVFDCYLNPNSAPTLDAADVEAAFRSFALGLNAADDSLSGRMDGLSGWFDWVAFIDSYFETKGRLANDDANWRLIQRGVLYGALLHAQHDRYVCSNGTHCRVQPEFKPAGLTDTDEASLRTYVYKTLDQRGVQAALDELAHKVTTNPQLYPLRKSAPPAK